jgi:predicted nuclease with TOPRIM domain
MIGFEYKGQAAYVTRLDDFREYMEPEIYEAVQKAFENGFDGRLRQEYEELQEDYKDLQREYDQLECEVGDIEEVQEELDECEEERDALQEKYDTITNRIKALVNQYYQRYIEPEDIIPELERVM